MNRLRFHLEGTVAKEITVPSNFFKFSPTKDLAPFSLHSPQKPSFKAINYQFIVADIIMLSTPNLQSDQVHLTMLQYYTCMQYTVIHNTQMNLSTVKWAQ